MGSIKIVPAKKSSSKIVISPIKVLDKKTIKLHAEIVDKLVRLADRKGMTVAGVASFPKLLLKKGIDPEILKKHPSLIRTAHSKDRAAMDEIYRRVDAMNEKWRRKFEEQINQKEEGKSEVKNFRPSVPIIIVTGLDSRSRERYVERVVISIPGKRQAMSKNVKVSKSEVIALFVALGYDTAAKWPDKRLVEKIKTLPKTVDDDVELEDEQAATLKALLKGLSKGQTLELTADELEEEEKPAKKGKKEEAKPAKKKAKDEDDEEEDEDEEESEDDDSEDEDEEEEDSDEDESEDEEEEDEEEDEKPAKKGKKAPAKKSKKDEDEDEDEEEEDEDSDEEEEDEDEDEKPAKKKGKKDEKPAKKSKKSKDDEDEDDDDEDEKEDVKKKKKAPPVKKGPGVIQTIIKCLRNASEKKPTTKEKILKKLVEAFPEREEKAMKSTIGSQIPSGLKTEKGLEVETDGEGGYWLPAEDE